MSIGENKILTILVEIIMSVFIANFKASEHPIINVIVRGFLIMITILVLGLFSVIKDGKDFSIGFSLSFFIYLIEVFFNYIDRNK